MSYAKSKSSYPAVVHAFVATIAHDEKARSLPEIILPFPSDNDAIRYRFQIYGLISAMDPPNKAKVKASLPPGKRPSQQDIATAQDVRTAQLAREWAITLVKEADSPTGQAQLIFRKKNGGAIAATIFSFIESLQSVPDTCATQGDITDPTSSTDATSPRSREFSQDQINAIYDKTFTLMVEELPGFDLTTFRQNLPPNLPSPDIAALYMEEFTEEYCRRLGADPALFLRGAFRPQFLGMLLDSVRQAR